MPPVGDRDRSLARVVSTPARSSEGSGSMLLDSINAPADLRSLDQGQLAQLARELRQCINETVSAKTGEPYAKQDVSADY